MKALLTHLEEADKSIGNFVEKFDKIVRRYTPIFLSLLDFFLVICAIIIAALLVRSNRNFWRTPISYEVSIPQFAGRIKSQSELHPGTFTVEVDFSQTGQWGGDGLMSYGVASRETEPDKNGYVSWTSGIIFEAWRPDPKTAGVYEHAIKFIPSLFPDNYKVKNVFFNQGKLKVNPVLDEDSVLNQIVINLLGLVLSFCFFMKGLLLVAKNLKRSIAPAPAQT